jgi:hypothetical protein
VTKELAVASRQCTVSHFLFHREIFDRKQHDCCPAPTLFVSVFSIEDETEMLTFDTIEVNDAESQVVLNTHKEHNFQEAFKKKLRSSDNRTSAWKGLLRG